VTPSVPMYESSKNGFDDAFSEEKTELPHGHYRDFVSGSIALR